MQKYFTFIYLHIHLVDILSEIFLFKWTANLGGENFIFLSASSLLTIWSENNDHNAYLIYLMLQIKLQKIPMHHSDSSSI